MCRIIIWKGPQPPLLTVVFGGPIDLVEAERRRLQMERSRRNSDWLQSHWAELLPQAQGKFIAVAAEEGFIANTLEEAWDWTRQAHPEGDGAVVQYAQADSNLRIYAHRG
jgi:hypothetical protein